MVNVIINNPITLNQQTNLLVINLTYSVKLYPKSIRFKYKRLYINPITINPNPNKKKIIRSIIISPIKLYLSAIKFRNKIMC